MAEIVDFGLQQHKIKMDSRYFENVLSVVAGDTGRRLEVQLLDTNGIVQDTTGLSLRLNAEIAGKATFTDATLVDAATGKYQLDLSNGMFLAPGNWQFQWQITDSAGKKLHSFAFTGNIGKNISEGGSQATNFYLNLEDLKAMQEDLVNGTIDSSVLETNITEKLTNLETQYAPRLTEVTAQLAQTMTLTKKSASTFKPEPLRFIAHRGAEAVVPENTLLAAEYACAMGYDGVEGDMQVTSDGEWVMFHDDTLDLKTNGTGTVKSKTLAQIKALDIVYGAYATTRYAGLKIPTLREWLEVCMRWGKIPMPEIKAAETSDMQSLFDIFEEFNALDKVYVQGNQYTLYHCKENIYSDFKAVPLINPTPENIVTASNLLPYSTAAINHELATEEVVRAIHDANMQCAVWTVNNTHVDKVKDLKAWGVSFIMGGVL